MCATTEAELIWMFIMKRVAPVVYRAIRPTMWGAIPERSPLEALFMQDGVVVMDPISLILTSLDFKGAFPNTPHRLPQAIREHMGLPSQGFLQVYLATRLYAVQTDVSTTPWSHPTSGVPQRGAESPFLFLLVTLPLAFYTRRTYPGVAPYPLRTTPPSFADHVAVVTATARQLLSGAPDNVRANQVLRDITSYPESNQQLVHNVQSDTMVHNAPSPPLLPPDAPMTPTDNLTYLGTQQRATPEGVTLPPNLERSTNPHPSHRAHSSAVHPGPGVLPTSRAKCSHRVPCPAPDTPQTHAAKGRHHNLTCVGHPRPPAHIPPCRGPGSISAILRGQHRPPGP